jgi:hypothetical protein
MLVGRLSQRLVLNRLLLPSIPDFLRAHFANPRSLVMITGLFAASERFRTNPFIETLLQSGISRVWRHLSAI